MFKRRQNHYSPHQLANGELEPKRYLAKRWLWLILSVVIIALAAGGVYYKSVYGGYFPYKIRKQLHIALYYPVHPAQGMQVDRSSFMVPAKDVVTYVVKDNKNNKFYVTVQAQPSNFNFADFKQRLGVSNEFITSAGNAFIVDLGRQITANILTPKKSWILISTQAFTEQPELEVLCQSFVASN